jgi:enoyl-[acyl-carrier-protein] reductase (NADH)
VLTYLGERQKVSIDALAPDLNVALIHPCDVTKDEELAALTEALAAGLRARAGRQRLFAGGAGAIRRSGDD